MEASTQFVMKQEGSKLYLFFGLTKISLEISPNLYIYLWTGPHKFLRRTRRGLTKPRGG